MKGLINVAAASFLAVNLAHAQGPAPKLQFEVSSVRVQDAPGESGVALGLRMDGAQARISGRTLREVIAMAFRVRPDQVSGPDWMSEHLEINAKLPAGAKADQIPDMLQSLLDDRFALKFHRETRDMPIYALLVGKPPLKLVESAPASDAPPPAPGVNVAASGSAAGVFVDLGNGSSYSFEGGKFDGKKLTARTIAVLLERYTDRPILDLTSLKGTYDISFTVSAEDYRALLVRAAVNSGVVLPPRALRLLDSAGASPLVDAVEQLGLKLDSRKAAIDVIAVDQVRKTPTDN